MIKIHVYLYSFFIFKKEKLISPKIKFINFIILVIHVCIREEKFEILRVVTESYYDIIEDKEIFYQWFCSENSDNMNPFDLSAMRSNKDIIKYIYEIIKRRDFLKFKLLEKRNNFFHYAAKKNECYSIVSINIITNKNFWPLNYYFNKVI